MEQFENMTIGDLRKIAQDYKKLYNHLTYVKIKYPKAKEELEEKYFDINKFIESL